MIQVGEGEIPLSAHPLQVGKPSRQEEGFPRPALPRQQVFEPGDQDRGQVARDYAWLINAISSCCLRSYDALVRKSQPPDFGIALPGPESSALRAHFLVQFLGLPAGIVRVL